jgi:integrase
VVGFPKVAQIIGWLETLLGADSKAVTVTATRINALADRLRDEEKLSPRGVEYHLAILKRAFNLARQTELLPHVPHVPGVRVRNTRTGFIEDPELEGILSHLPEVLRTAIRFIALTGWRKREVLLLQWRQVDWTAKVVRLDPGSTKNDEGRVFPLGAFPELEEVLRLQRAYTDERAGVSRSVAMKLTGHKTEAVYRRYARVRRG